MEILNDNEYYSFSFKTFFIGDNSIGHTALKII